MFQRFALKWADFAGSLSHKDVVIFLIVAGVLITAGILLVALGIKAAKTRRLIRETPTSNSGSMLPGFRELKGKIVPLAALQTPVSLKNCVYYKVTVEQYRSNGKGGNWVTIGSYSDTADFLLDDGYGKVLISAANLRQAKLELNTDRTNQQGMFHEFPEDVKRFLQSVHIDDKGLLFRKQLKVTEVFLEPGDALYALGWVDNAPGPEGARYSLRKEKGKPFLVSDQGEEKLLKNYLALQAVLLSIGSVLILGPIVFLGLRIFVF